VGGESKSINFALFGRFFPIINLYSSDDNRSSNREEIFRLALVGMPGADVTASVIFYPIKAFHALEVERVNEANFAAIIDSNVAVFDFWYRHC